MNSLFKGIYKNRTVLLTGHTGFKGSWLSYWLRKMGANVIGYSKQPSTQPNHFNILNIDMVSVIGDICDQGKLEETFQKYQPEIVFHLAAQSLVRVSYEEPINTFETNVIGTLKVFEACKKTPSVRAVVNITSDKAYENREWVWGYRESDPMGGFDPYSASKGCAELLTSSYRNSYFNPNHFGASHHVLLASCRAGNVIGGGDWAQDRLLVDAMVLASQKRKVKIRHPRAIRPWQHVLEPLSGYLLLAQKLFQGEKEFADGWNFGPREEMILTVQEVLVSLQTHWQQIDFEVASESNQLHEAGILKLDCSKAHIKLGWQNIWEIHHAIERTVSWYRQFYENGAINTEKDIEKYTNDAIIKGVQWAC